MSASRTSDGSPVVLGLTAAILVCLGFLTAVYADIVGPVSTGEHAVSVAVSAHPLPVPLGDVGRHVLAVAMPLVLTMLGVWASGHVRAAGRVIAVGVAGCLAGDLARLLGQAATSGTWEVAGGDVVIATAFAAAMVILCWDRRSSRVLLVVIATVMVVIATLVRIQAPLPYLIDMVAAPLVGLGAVVAASTLSRVERARPEPRGRGVSPSPTDRPRPSRGAGSAG
ncbi:MAG: hypothetical protein Q4G43_11160 [Mobilicoccus sp.]|nr:hypothetical protein [Mobilicoccus sp.]